MIYAAPPLDRSTTKPNKDKEIKPLTLPLIYCQGCDKQGICKNEHRAQFFLENRQMDDTVVASLPIYLSTALVPNLQLYQFPLLQRPLQAPPSAKIAGKKINARFKPEADVIEIHVPFDTREDVWNKKQGREYGQHRAEEDGQKAITKEERRLDDLRLKSERIPEGAAYMVGVIHDSKLYCCSLFFSFFFFLRSDINPPLLQINCTFTVFRPLTNFVQT